MKRFIALTLFALAFGFSASAQAHDGVALDNAWARATPGGVTNGAAYLTIANHSKEMDRLLSASTDVAGKAEIHNHVNENGIMRMRQVDAIDIPGEGSVELRPGGYHIMLLDLKKPLTEGAEFTLTLTFERVGEQTVTVTTKKIGAMGAMNQGDMHGMGH